MELAAKYGRIIVIGNRGEITVNPRVAMMNELDIRGVALWNATAAQMKSFLLDILAGVAEGSLRPVVGREMRLSEGGGASCCSGARRWNEGSRGPIERVADQLMRELEDFLRKQLRERRREAAPLTM